MNQFFQKAKKFVVKHDEAFIGAAFVLVVVIAVAAVAYINSPKIVYQPAKACELFTPAEAQEMLGEKVLSTEANEPTIKDDMATSKCSYTDENPDQNAMLVAAVAIQSGINDTGVAKNKADFPKAKAAKGMEAVNDIGDSAFFNPTRGQLNVLKGKDWFIFSYGVGASPQENTLEKQLELARKTIA